LEVSIGCTGWGYDGWSGQFYPKNLRPSEFLRFYSSVFDITEINSTFYKIPDESTTKKWDAQTPPHFRFTAKLPQVMTHQNRLQNILPHMEQFLSALKPLRSKYMFTVVQLPPSLAFDDARPHLETVGSYLNRYVIEGRHKSWFSDDAIKYLSDRNICLVWNDVVGVDNILPITSDFVYLRIIGDRSIPESKFGFVHRDRIDDLKLWKEKIMAHEDKLSFAAILANNHYEGFGVATASKLRLLFGLDDVQWYSRYQKKLAEFQK
jgi:uncharacterized protein YecE (DUF72 family)